MMNIEAEKELARQISINIKNGVYSGRKDEDIMEDILGMIAAIEDIYKLQKSIKGDTFPGDLPLCKDCMLNLRQCEMMTSTNRCKIWNDYEKNK